MSNENTERRKLDLFVDVESRQKQAEALRRLAAMVEAGEVFAVVSIVVARDTEAGPVSEASDWRDVGQPELASPARAAFISHIIAHHCLTLNRSLFPDLALLAFAEEEAAKGEVET